MEESNHAKGVAIEIESDDERIESSSAAEPEGKHDSMDENISSVNRGKPQSLTNSLNSVALDARSGNPNNVNARKANSHKQYKPENWMLPDQAEDSLIQLNLAIVSKVIRVFFL